MCCSKLGTGPKTYEQLHPPSPPRCPLPLLSHRIRTRPSRTALSSEANINQPQMFMLGEKGQQMQSHSIKLLPFPLCLTLFWLSLSLCLSFCKSTKNPGELFRCVGVTTLLYLPHSQLSQCSESPGFPLKKKRKKYNSLFQFFKLPDTEQWSLRLDYCRGECYLQKLFRSVLWAKLSSFRRILAHLSPLYLMIKKKETQPTRGISAARTDRNIAR